MPSVFVISRDWMLRAGLRAELLAAGLDALGMESIADAGAALSREHIPSVIVLDAAVDAAPAERESLQLLARQVPILLIASHANPAAAPPPWLPQVAAVIHRPARIADVVARVQDLLRGQAA